jgi:hypothetical protein
MTEAAEKIDVVDTGQADKTVVDTAANENADKAQDKTAVTDTTVTDTTTTADDKGGDQSSDKPALPDNWRELGLEAAGFNKEQKDRAEKLISRYGSLGGVVKALLEKDDFIRSGKIKRDMPDPKDEKAMAEWRKEQGIPEKPEGYQLPEPLQKRLVDDDKPILSNFMERMHGKNWTPQQIQDGVEWYADFQEQIAEQISQRDEQAKEEADNALRDNWSRDEYKGNLTLAKRFWDSTGIEALSEARLPDGRKLGNVPEFIMFSSDKGRESFGDVVFSSGDAETKFNNRKAEIEKIRDTDFERYEREYAAEYRTILEKELQRGKR